MLTNMSSILSRDSHSLEISWIREHNVNCSIVRFRRVSLLATLFLVSLVNYNSATIMSS